MLLAIHGGNVEGYAGGQESIIYLVSTAQAIKEASSQFVYTDGHGIMAITDFFDDLSDLNKIDWEIMKERYWANTPEDGDRKRRRQAEFLVHKFCPWTVVKMIGVLNQTAENQVLELISKESYKPEVKVKGNWYY